MDQNMELSLPSQPTILINPTHLIDAELEKEISNIPNKMAFKIGEAAKIVGVKSYVLRYWETEFDFLKPKKSKHNQRIYSKKDIENVLLIKKLLYRDRFSIEGARSAYKTAKKQLKQNSESQIVQNKPVDFREELEELLETISLLKRSYE